MLGDEITCFWTDGMQQRRNLSWTARGTFVSLFVLLTCTLALYRSAAAQDSHYWSEQYGTRSELLGRKLRPGETPVLERHALHAGRLGFRHPLDERWIEFEAPFPPDLAALWKPAEEDRAGETGG